VDEKTEEIVTLSVKLEDLEQNSEKIHEAIKEGYERKVGDMKKEHSEENQEKEVVINDLEGKIDVINDFQ